MARLLATAAAGVASVSLALGLVACRGPGAATDAPAAAGSATRLETDPPGARVYVDGLLAGQSPVSVVLPASPAVTVRLERDGSETLTVELRRRTGTPAGAPPGEGWDAVYYWALVERP